MKKNSVIYNGVSVSEDWPQKINESQLIKIFTFNEKTASRIPYGDESFISDDDDSPCSDCAVLKKQFHVIGCDTEVCPFCQNQVISCDCKIKELGRA